MDGYNTCEIDMTESIKKEVIMEARKVGLDLEIQIFQKNNTTKEGFVLKTVSDAAPVFYTDYYEEMPVSDIVSNILQVSKALKSESFSVNQVVESIKNQRFTPDMLRRCVVCKNTNKEMLVNMPHRILQGLDIAIYYCIRLSSDMSIPITNELVTILGWSEEDMYLFTENEEYMYSDVGDILFGSGKYKPVANVTNIGYKSLFVLKNADSSFGASVISHFDVLKKMSEAFDGKNLIILPSSVHEVLIIPDYLGIEPETDDVEALAQMVSEVNLNEVATEDKLSDSVYRYVYTENKIELIAGSAYVDEEVASYE